MYLEMLEGSFLQGRVLVLRTLLKSRVAKSNGNQTEVINQWEQ